MTVKRLLTIVGAGPVFAVARAIATDLEGEKRVVAVELPPDRIAETDVRSMLNRPPAESDVFAAIGLHALNHARADLCAKFAEAGYPSVTLVHRRASVERSAILAPNVLVCAGTSIGSDAVVEAGAVILDGARIEAGARVGAFAWIGANVVIGFDASVGAHTILRSGVNVDAGVPIGDHCELATPGLRQAAVVDRTFDTAAFEQPVRIYRGRCRA